MRSKACSTNDDDPKTLLHLALCASLIVGVAPAALAAPPDYASLPEEKQRELASLIDLAEANAERGEHEKALGFFEDAYELFPHPQLLYRQALLHEELDQLELAATKYEQFSQELPEAPEAPSARRKALELREQLRQQRTQEELSQTSLRILTTPPGAQVYFSNERRRQADGLDAHRRLARAPGHL